MCRQKDAKAVQGCALKTRRTGTPARNGCAVPDRGLNGAYKVSQMHLPPPNLPRFGGGERPPLLCKPPAPLTITLGQRLAVFASPNTPSDRLPPCTCPPIRAPFPPSGKGVGGKGRCAAATLGAILCAVRIDLRREPEINPYPAQPATGVLGQRPKRVLLPFTRVKGTPRRVGVLIKSIIRLAPPEVITDFLTSAPVRRTKAPPTFRQGELFLHM